MEQSGQLLETKYKAFQMQQHIKVVSSANSTQSGDRELNSTNETTFQGISNVTAEILAKCCHKQKFFI